MRLAIVLVIGACGRIGFDGITADTAAPTCNLQCAPVTLAMGQGDLRQILTDATHVYWAGPGAIKRVAKTGGMPEIVATFSGTGFRMTERDGYLYWVTRDTGIVARALKQPNAVTELIAQGQGDVGGIVADGIAVYWDTYPTAGKMFRRDLTAVQPVEILPATDKLTGMRLAGSTIYYLRESLGIYQINTDGTLADQVSPGIGTFELAIDGDDVFVANAAATGIVRVSRTTTAQTPIATANGPWGIAVDATHVYYANEFGNTIARAPRGGGTEQMLAPAQVPVGIAVDDQGVYWTTRGGDVVMLAK